METATKTAKERPILFSGEMVNAIRAGRKTQTRRVVNPQPPYRWTRFEMLDDIVRWAYQIPSLDWFTSVYRYGKPGDRLWVRETHLLDPPDDGTWCYYDYSDGVLHNVDAIPKRFRNSDHVVYRAAETVEHSWKWRPSIFMPRWASRIELEITNVRVERLNEISEEDARAEGYEYKQLHAMHEEAAGVSLMTMPDDPRLWFRTLWGQINGKKHPWSSNPWVWCVEFRKV